VLNIYTLLAKLFLYMDANVLTKGTPNEEKIENRNALSGSRRMREND
jgi:hypothetical protein